MKISLFYIYFATSILAFALKSEFLALTVFRLFFSANLFFALSSDNLALSKSISFGQFIESQQNFIKLFSIYIIPNEVNILFSFPSQQTNLVTVGIVPIIELVWLGKISIFPSSL